MGDAPFAQSLQNKPKRPSPLKRSTTFGSGSRLMSTESKTTELVDAERMRWQRRLPGTRRPTASVNSANASSMGWTRRSTRSREIWSRIKPSKAYGDPNSM